MAGFIVFLNIPGDGSGGHPTLGGRRSGRQNGAADDADSAVRRRQSAHLHGVARNDVVLALAHHPTAARGAARPPPPHPYVLSTFFLT